MQKADLPGLGYTRYSAKGIAIALNCWIRWKRKAADKKFPSGKQKDAPTVAEVRQTRVCCQQLKTRDLGRFLDFFPDTKDYFNIVVNLHCMPCLRKYWRNNA